MDDTNLGLGILERAMAIEREGRDFYLKASKTSQDKKGQEIFTMLAGDEKRHYDLIKRQQNALSDKGKWAISPDIKPVTIDLNKILFPVNREALEKSVTKKSNDWDAIVFGLEIEIISFEMYRQAERERVNAFGKKLFEFLAGEEMGHYNTLLTRYDQLFGPLPSYNR